MSKRKAEGFAIPVWGDESDILKITPLGGGQEVGRSCMLLEYKGKTVMVMSEHCNYLTASHFF
ncbi:hypothetical protein BJ742DRAFT_783950 [Cladochytrium replicatum]|nr:hypothetical protein BJ742DRAFT_783950 [Cladochytrium replicatum]